MSSRPRRITGPPNGEQPPPPAVIDDRGPGPYPQERSPARYPEPAQRHEYAPRPARDRSRPYSPPEESSPSNATIRVILNDGLAAIIYLIIGRIIARALWGR